MDFQLSELIANFHFLRPLFLLGLIPAVGIILLLRFLHNQQSNWSKTIAPELLPFLLDKSQSPKHNRAIYGLLFIWLASIISLAGPAWQQIPVPVQEREDALVIVMDLSLSMYTDDLQPNRLVRARRKLLDILNSRQEEGQTALVVYAGDAHAVTPMTDDVATISTMISALSPNLMPSFGSKPVAGIQMAINLLENAELPEAQILLMTDGINNTDIRAIQNLLTGTQHILSVLGIGTEAGAPIPMEEGGFLRDQNDAIVIPKLGRNLLQELASRTNGRYSDILLNDSDISYLLDQSVFNEKEGLIETEREFDSWYEAGPWLLLLVLPIAAFAFRQGWLLSLCFMALLIPEKQAYAWGWTDLWVRSDQQASQVFAEEDYQQAADLFKDENWRAAANYRSENYELALADLALQGDADIHYNRGNTLARLNRYEEAVQSYQQALALAPDHADAEHNKAIIENLLEQQQQEPSPPDDEGSEEQDQDQEQQDGEQSEQEQQEQSEQQSDDNGESQDSEQEQEQDQEESDEDSEGENQEQAQESDQSEEQSSEADAEEEQAMQQWLGRIQDNPGELLRNKFQYQTQKRLYEQLQNPNLTEQEAKQQTW